MYAKMKYYLDACRRLGTINVLVYLWKLKVLERIYAWNKPLADAYRIGQLYVKQSPHPLFFRYGSSDLWVFSQIFIRNEYGKIANIHDIRSIIDCGANIGYSSAYFLMNYPQVQIMAVEPDSRNFELLTRNTAPYASRVTCIQKALWSHQTGLKISTDPIGEANEWATTVRACQSSESADVQATDIYSLMKEFGKDTIDILKVDIEGSEEVVFRSNYDRWLERIGIVVIELHGEQAEQAFFGALGSQDFEFSRSDELTVARRRSS